MTSTTSISEALKQLSPEHSPTTVNTNDSSNSTTPSNTSNLTATEEKGLRADDLYYLLNDEVMSDETKRDHISQSLAHSSGNELPMQTIQSLVGSYYHVFDGSKLFDILDTIDKLIIKPRSEQFNQERKVNKKTLKQCLMEQLEAIYGERVVLESDDIRELTFDFTLVTPPSDSSKSPFGAAQQLILAQQCSLNFEGILSVFECLRQMKEGTNQLTANLQANEVNFDQELRETSGDIQVADIITFVTEQFLEAGNYLFAQCNIHSLNTYEIDLMCEYLVALNYDVNSRLEQVSPQAQKIIIQTLTAIQFAGQSAACPTLSNLIRTVVAPLPTELTYGTTGEEDSKEIAEDAHVTADGADKTALETPGSSLFAEIPSLSQLTDEPSEQNQTTSSVSKPASSLTGHTSHQRKSQWHEVSENKKSHFADTSFQQFNNPKKRPVFDTFESKATVIGNKPLISSAESPVAIDSSNHSSRHKKKVQL